MQEAEPTTQVAAFKSLFDTITGSVDRYGAIAERGAGHTLLAVGAWLVGITLATKIISMFIPQFLGAGTMSSLDLAILVAGAITMLVGGVAIRIWERWLEDAREQRKDELRLKAAEQVKEVLVGSTSAAPVSVNRI